ncbi:OLC1v1001480C1 [Oldenlandia corymbosa var. corymbosa]|uniref:OLC1v1001480C1 n=1 Tax=Oldenlandia corymbosa var. corymbosa TaxID=529605 RepID=A0AAV1D895_OLDCO|nr:OLC1v1001480C1 [Oldenlandia corymbosa var. corymbosa]
MRHQSQPPLKESEVATLPLLESEAIAAITEAQVVPPCGIEQILRPIDVDGEKALPLHDTVDTGHRVASPVAGARTVEGVKSISQTKISAIDEVAGSEGKQGSPSTASPESNAVRSSDKGSEEFSSSERNFRSESRTVRQESLTLRPPSAQQIP